MTRPHPAEPPAPAFLRLDHEAVALLGHLLDEIVAPLGLDGSKLVAAMAQGRSVTSALGFPPGLEAVLYARAHSWFAAGRHERAESLFQALCTLNSRSADYWVGYGVCLRMSGRIAEADLAFAAAATLRPDWAVPFFHAAELALGQHDWARAATHLAAFNARQTADVPTPMRSEAARLTKALQWRQSKQVG